MQDPKSGKRMPKLWNKKPIAVLQAEAADVATQELMTHGDVPLKRTLSAMSLMALGIGNIIGAGIFVLTGHAAAAHAGPAIGLSFVVSAIACAFAGMCYAEMASSVPISGSAYTYAYATMGEIIAWIIGWDLLLEYALGAATVAIGWSGYVVSFLKDFGILRARGSRPSFTPTCAGRSVMLHLVQLDRSYSPVAPCRATRQGFLRQAWRALPQLAPICSSRSFHARQSAQARRHLSGNNCKGKGHDGRERRHASKP